MEETSYNKSQLNYIGEGYYSYSVTMVNKGQEIPYIRIFAFFMSIDFSNNKFHGEIPRTIRGLRTLVVLNLSSNNFTGPVPLSLGNLIKLESLYLAKNKLSGQIRQQFTRLMFLEYLNLSDNELVGPIPQAGQIGIFENSSEGNWGLCGPPLSKKCGTSLLPPHDNEKSGDSILSGFGWEAVAIRYGCGLIIGLMLGYIITSRSPYLVFKIFHVIPPMRLKGINS
ncbi:putative receptor like protein 25 [Ziziphus jujuba]|uniref:Receptor like protein 25 n=1 Tax=Ziziphus jujuba TaxID=326968 RepID=A0A6P6G7A5_ZIZJJ|nr:putative receptor like protein 25 [Ziziphus jujuba]